MTQIRRHRPGFFADFPAWICSRVGGFYTEGLGMSDAWIKMRASILRNPKLIIVSKCLPANDNFSQWLTPGYSGREQLVSDSALCCVTVGALLAVWSAARENGKWDGDDLVLLGSALDDLDVISGVPGLGVAMQAAGWAKVGEDGIDVTFPNFSEWNVSKTNAERQADYRLRKSGGNDSVTEPLQRGYNKPVTRVEKSKEEKGIYIKGGVGGAKKRKRQTNPIRLELGDDV